jgi:hypothetical protein
LHQAGEVLYLENRTTDWNHPPVSMMQSPASRGHALSWSGQSIGWKTTAVPVHESGVSTLTPAQAYKGFLLAFPVTVRKS